MKGNSAVVSLPSTAFRAFVAAILCAGLMIPTSLTTNRAYADEPTSTYSHGAIAISSDEAADGVIQLEVGQTATITVTPYQHVQYEGCHVSGCPEVCEDMEVPGGGECFVAGYGCKCDKTPHLRQAVVTTTVGDNGIVAASEIAPASTIEASEATLGEEVNGTITLTAAKVGETTVKVDAVGQGDPKKKTDELQFWNNASQIYTVKVVAAGSDEPEQGAPAIAADQVLDLRATIGNLDATVNLENVDAEWATSVTGVTVTPFDNDGKEEAANVLTPDQYTIDPEAGTLVLHRTAEDPIVTAKPGDLVDGKGATVIKWGQEKVRPNAKEFKISISVEGSDEPVEGIVTAATASVDKIRIKEIDSSGAVVKETEVTYDQIHNADTYRYQNSSAQCGMAGVRTFSGYGIGLDEVLEMADVSFEEGDAIELNTPDVWPVNKTWYDFYGRDLYFFQGAYDDEAVHEAYKSGDETQVRLALANAALEDKTYAAPFVSDNYTETILGTDEVVGLDVPTAGNFEPNSLVTSENVGRFMYGIPIVQEDVTVTFDTGAAGIDVESQTVKSHPMSSTEGNTMYNTYWLSDIVITKGGDTATHEPSTAADKLTEPADPERDGYEFGGWYTDEACTEGNEFDFEANDGTVDENTTLYAKWIPTDIVINDGQQIQLRQSGDTGTARVSLTNATAEWAAAVEGVSVKAVNGNYAGAVTELSADQYAIDAENGRITFNRTEDAPVFSVAVGEGEPLEVTNRWGETITYPQSKQYEITISAEGYDDVIGTATFYTGGNEEFKIIVDSDGNPDTTNDQQVVKTYTQAQLEGMSSFQNGSSQCGMTGFRTFSANGVSLKDLLEGVEYGEGDSFLINTVDNFGKEFSYDELFGTARYFLQAAYDDPEVAEVYAQVTSDADSGSDTALRRVLAEKAQEDNTTVEPLIAPSYVETMLSGDNVGEATVPTEENTHFSELVAAENQYRFIYGIALAQDDVTLTFDTGVEGLEVPAQTVKSHLMTSTDNTTIRTTYWSNELIVYKGGAEEQEPSTAADKLTEPEAPVRDGYTFAGWYTKDGSADGDWGEEFDFSANDGTVDEDTTIYAKWVEGKVATDATVSAYREAQYGEPPAGDTSDAGQHVQAVIAFDSPVTITDQEALLESLTFNINNSAASGVTAKADGNTLVLDAVLPFALMGGQVNISANAEDGTLAGVTVADEAPRLDSPIATYADTGLTFEVVEAIQGTSTTPASTTFKVTHSANVRSMNHVVWLTNKGTEATGSNILGGAEWTAAHHHTFYNFTLDDSAESIVSNATNPEGTNLADYGYTVTQGENGTFTITANKPVAGEVLSAAVYTDSFFHSTGLAMGEDVTGVAMPEASYPAVDLGMAFPEDAEYVSTSMGRDQAGKVDFSLTPSDDAVKTWQEYYGESATAQDLLTAWIEGITSVSIDGVALEQKAFADYVDQLTDAVSDQGKFNYYDLSAGSSRATLTLPIALFDTTESETDTKTVTIESTGFGTVTGDVTYRNLGSDSLVIRTVDSDGNVLSSTVLTMDQLKALDVQEHYNTSANCGMAGLRTYNSEGVLLTDVLAAAGVEFGEGDVLHVRVNDGLPQNGDENTTETGYWNQSTFTYDELMGVVRYYYPDAWDTTPREELGGQSIYDLLSADRNAWKGDSDQAVALAKLLGQNKQAVEPLIAWSWNEGRRYLDRPGSR